VSLTNEKTGAFYTSLEDKWSESDDSAAPLHIISLAELCRLSFSPLIRIDIVTQKGCGKGTPSRLPYDKYSSTVYTHGYKDGH